MEATSFQGLQSQPLSICLVSLLPAINLSSSSAETLYKLNTRSRSATLWESSFNTSTKYGVETGQIVVIDIHADVEGEARIALVGR